MIVVVTIELDDNEILKDNHTKEQAMEDLSNEIESFLNYDKSYGHVFNIQEGEIPDEQ